MSQPGWHIPFPQPSAGDRVFLSHAKANPDRPERSSSSGTLRWAQLGILPRTTATVGSSLGPQKRFDQFPLGIAQFPSPLYVLLCRLSYTHKIAK